MIKNELFEYIEGNTIWHKAHPATKIIIIVFLIITSWYNMYCLFISFILIVISLILLLREHKKAHIISFYLTLGALLFIINTLIYSVLVPNKTQLIFGILSHHGLLLSLLLTLRILLTIIATHIFFLSTTIEDLEDFLISLRIPFELILSFSLTILFIPIIIDEITRIREAQILRGLGKAKLSRKIFTYLSSLLLPLMISALNRASRLAEVLEIYGVPPHERTILGDLKFSLNDIIILLILIPLILIILLSI